MTTFYAAEATHAARHAKGAEDEVSPASIGAPTLDTGGKLPLSQLPISALLCILEISGSYANRPVWSGPVAWIGYNPPATGGTTTSGTNFVDNLDIWIRTAS